LIFCKVKLLIGVCDRCDSRDWNVENGGRHSSGRSPGALQTEMMIARFASSLRRAIIEAGLSLCADQD